MPEVKQRHRVGLAADLPPGSHRVVRAGNRELGIFNIGSVSKLALEGVVTYTPSTGEVVIGPGMALAK